MTVDRGQDWRSWAACQDFEENLWLADAGDGTRGRSPHSTFVRSQHARAKAICATCPVIEECLGFALSVPAEVDKHGVLGGLNPAERRALRPAPGPRRYGRERLDLTAGYIGGRTGRVPR